MIGRPERLALISYYLFFSPTSSFLLSKQLVQVSRTSTLHSECTLYSSPQSTDDVSETTTESLIDDPSNTNQNRTNFKRDYEGPVKSFWKPKRPKARWQERIDINDLKVGQELNGEVVEELLEGKTGPKLFFECGVGRTNPKTGKWSIVNGMLRLDRGKVSVTKKRAARYRKKGQVQLFVARVQPECARLEVCTDVEDLKKYSKIPPKVSITSLVANQEVVGEVVRLLPYGALIDVGANRRGLLHISKVAELYNRFIKTERGLENAGLEKGSRVRLKVASNDKRRLSLDFTDDVIEAAQKSRILDTSPDDAMDSVPDVPDEELAAWEEYAKSQLSNNTQIFDDKLVMEKSIDNQPADSEDDYSDDDDEEYDEDADIEDSLGIGMY
jgi:predicted RNA-binding protein with RPS1 domain